MLYEDKYLVFPDQATQLQYYDMSDPEDPVNQFSQLNWDIIGTIYEPTGETQTDDEGNETPVMAPVEGWHVNITYHFLADFPTELEQYVIDMPETPYRIRPVKELTEKRRKNLSVSRLQADKMLRLLGIKEDVDAWIGTQEESTKAAYNLAYRFERNDQIFKDVKTAFGWSDLDLDKLFSRSKDLD
jgi:hypothetical protein